MHFEHITTERQLLDFCQEIASAPTIGFDTEFVSEDTYRPELCLIQVAAGGKLAVIDPLEIDDVTPFWELLASDGHETIVHSGREEFRFCRHAIGRRPGRLFDIQLAAGLIGMEYPAAYSSLVSKLVGKALSKGETRTDWRRRPLSDHQMEYALQDVVHLEPARNTIMRKLEKLGRQSWLATEMEAWQQDVEVFETSERWRRVSGIAGLSSRHLAIVRELWLWRDSEADRRNWPPKRVLRDDLIVELARRQTSDPKRIRAVRGLERGDIQRHMNSISDRIDKALALKDEDCPKPTARSARPQLSVLGQFMSTALGSICRSVNVAPSLVGTVDDVRDLIAYRLGMANDLNGSPPLLATGWRAEVVGQVIDELLAGKLSVRITNPHSEEPLTFDPVPGK